MIQFYSLCIVFVFITGIGAVFASGIKKHVFYLFITGIQIVYLFNTPVYRNVIENYYAINEDVKEYFPYGFLMILMHVVIFNICYFMTPVSRKYFIIKNITDTDNIRGAIFKLYIILYIIIFINTLIGGINLIDVVLGKSTTSTLGFAGASYYIQNLADSLITLIVAANMFKVKKRNRIIMNVTGFILFIILGFRYRILLTVFAIVLYNIHSKGIKAKLFFRYLTFVIIFFYAILFLTYNRIKFYTGAYDQIVYDIGQFDYDIFFEQAKGSLTDFAIYKALDKNVIESDHGRTMFLYIFIKMTPASFFPNHTKPYPPPQMIAVDKSINAGRDIGEATTMLGSFYYAFSIYGIAFISIILGLVTKRLSIPYAPPLIFLLNVMIMMAIFQFYTRGYFPQFIDHLAYMLFPLLFLRKYSRNIKPGQIQNV